MSLDDQIRQLSETILHELRSPIEDALQRVLADVMRLAADDRDEAVKAALAAAAADHEAATAALREQLEDGRVDMDAVRAQFEREMHASLTSLRDQLDREREAAVQAARDEAAASHQAQLEEQETRLSAEREAAVQAARDEAAASHLAHLEEQETRLSAEREAAIQAARDEAAASHQVQLEEQETRLSAEHVSAIEEERRKADESVNVTHAVDREQDMACTDRMLTAFRQLDDAHSLTEILNGLADRAAFETGRAAIMIATGTRLRGWALRGFPVADPSAIDVPLEPGTAFSLAVARGLPVSTVDAPVGQGDDPLSALLAVPAGRAGLAVPISVGGRTVAILYADDAGEETPVVPNSWPEIAEMLARHAGRCLEALTISHASVTSAAVRHTAETAPVRTPEATAVADHQRAEESARRYARLLVSELKLYNETAVEQGRAERNLLERLASDIERARRLYEEKIPESVSHRVDIFDQEVVRTLAGGDPDLLGHT
jgi:hypothetical protein